MSRRTIHRALRALAGTGAVLAVSLTGAAVAAAPVNVVHVTTPTNAKKNVSYAVKLGGVAVKKDRLYLFIDYYSCGSSPAVEGSHQAPGEVWTVHGSFSKTSAGWRSSLKAPDHACAYLVTFTSGHVLAHKFKTYRIH